MNGQEESLKDILNSKRDNYCIIDHNDNNHALCGRKLDSKDDELPSDEVPEEDTCKECWAVEQYLIRIGEIVP